jgi:hypothetical protein
MNFHCLFFESAKLSVDEKGRQNIHANITKILVLEHEGPGKD